MTSTEFLGRIQKVDKADTGAEKHENLFSTLAINALCIVVCFDD